MGLPRVPRSRRQFGLGDDLGPLRAPLPVDPEGDGEYGRLGARRGARSEQRSLRCARRSFSLRGREVWAQPVGIRDDGLPGPGFVRAPRAVQPGDVRAARPLRRFRGPAVCRRVPRAPGSPAAAAGGPGVRRRAGDPLRVVAVSRSRMSRHSAAEAAAPRRSGARRGYPRNGRISAARGLDDSQQGQNGRRPSPRRRLSSSCGRHAGRRRERDFLLDPAAPRSVHGSTDRPGSLCDCMDRTGESGPSPSA